MLRASGPGSDRSASRACACHITVLRACCVVVHIQHSHICRELSPVFHSTFANFLRPSREYAFPSFVLATCPGGKTAAKTARETSFSAPGALRPSPSRGQRIRRHGALAATPTPRCPCPDPRARALATGRPAGFSRNGSTRRPRRRSTSHRIRIQPSRARRLAAAGRPRPSWPLLREPSNALAPNHPTTHGPRLPPQHGFCGSWASCDPGRHCLRLRLPDPQVRLQKVDGQDQGGRGEVGANQEVTELIVCH